MKIGVYLWLVVLAAASFFPAASAAQEGEQAPATDEGAAPALSIEGADGEVRAGEYSLKIVGLDTSSWPDVRLDFSIVNRAGQPFGGLTASAITATHDDEVVYVGPQDLKLKRGGPMSALFMLDISGSMVSSGPSISKLGAARGALVTFVEQMGPKDQMAVGLFDESPFMLVGLTGNKQLLHDALVTFTTRPGHSNFTHLYDALDFGLRQAEKDKIQNVIFMSDGWEDTPETKELAGNPEALAAFKREREQRIAAFSRRTGIRVFTVAIGDRNGKGLAFVDYEALSNLAKGSDGGSVSYIDIPELQRKAGGDVEAYKKLFLTAFKDVFDSIGRSIRYDYALTLRLGDLPKDEREHVIRVTFKVENEELQAILVYTWKGGAAEAPLVKEKRAVSGILIAQPRAEATRPRLALIFFSLFTVLMFMALVPAVARAILTSDASARLRKAIVTVGGKSPFIGNQCPNERDGLGGQFLIREGDVVVVCPRCSTPHHISCWHLNRDSCWNRACEHEEPIPDEVARRYQLEEEVAGA